MVRRSGVAQEFADHEGELRVGKAEAEEDEALPDPEFLERVPVDARFVGLAGMTLS
jgi:hypothetical protein